MTNAAGAYVVMRADEQPIALSLGGGVSRDDRWPEDAHVEMGIRVLLPVSDDRRRGMHIRRG